MVAQRPCLGNFEGFQQAEDGQGENGWGPEGTGDEGGGLCGLGQGLHCPSHLMPWRPRPLPSLCPAEFISHILSHLPALGNLAKVKKKKKKSPKCHVLALKALRTLYSTPPSFLFVTSSSTCYLQNFK